jgi:hypothetical protein
LSKLEVAMKRTDAKSNASGDGANGDPTQRSIPTDDLRHHDHDFDRPEADALEQEMPVFSAPTASSSDAERIEPLDDGDSAYDEFRD